MTEGSFCGYFNRGECRSCKWIEQDYLAQISQKEAIIREELGFFPDFHIQCQWAPSVQSSLLGFRNRVKMGVTGSVAHPVVGLLGEENLDEGRELLSCPIHHKKLNEVIAALPEFIRSYNLIPYSIEARRGELKGIIAFYAEETNQAYLRFILRSKECVARMRKLVPEFQKQFPEVVCITANIQPIPHAIQEGVEEIFLTETREIELRLGGISLKLAPKAFVQTNIQVATELYQAAARWIGEVHPKRVLELFCGQGAFSLVAAEAKCADEFLGIEINKEAVRSANQTAQQMGLGHVNFKAADATQVGAVLLEFQPDLVLVNPPRRGLADGVRILKDALPSNLIYSSCSIATLALDLKVLSANYDLKRVQLFDMFPHTEHFETLVWLERKT